MAAAGLGSLPPSLSPVKVLQLSLALSRGCRPVAQPPSDWADPASPWADLQSPSSAGELAGMEVGDSSGSGPYGTLMRSQLLLAVVIPVTTRRCSLPRRGGPGGGVLRRVVQSEVEMAEAARLTLEEAPTTESEGETRWWPLTRGQIRVLRA